MIRLFVSVFSFEGMYHNMILFLKTTTSKLQYNDYQEIPYNEIGIILFIKE